MGRAQLNRYDAYKLAALAAMTLDHVAFFLLPDQLWMRAIGRAAMPIFCFLLGYNGHYRFRPSLLLAALALSLYEYLLLGSFHATILWELLLARLVLEQLPDAFLHRYWKEITALCCVLFLPGEALTPYSTTIFLWAMAGRSLRGASGSAMFRVVLAAATLLTLLHTWAMFHAYPAVFIGGGGAILMTALWLTQLNLTPWNPPAAGLARALSRQALAYYVAHLVLLMALYATLPRA